MIEFILGVLTTIGVIRYVKGEWPWGLVDPTQFLPPPTEPVVEPVEPLVPKTWDKDRG